MSGFFWNIRGFNKSKKQKVMKEWVQSNLFQFGCILETKVKESRALEVASRVVPGWNLLSNYELSRLGRIWVLWGPNISVLVEFKSSQLITCSIKMPNVDEEICCSFIYASNEVEARRELWRDLKNQQDDASLRGKPWIIFGDFNETLDLEDHSNSVSAPQITSGMCDFQDVVRYCSLSDMRTHGPLFTWYNVTKGMTG